MGRFRMEQRPAYNNQVIGNRRRQGPLTAQPHIIFAQDGELDIWRLDGDEADEVEQNKSSYFRVKLKRIKFGL